MSYEWDPVAGGYRWVGPGPEPTGPAGGGGVDLGDEPEDSDDPYPEGTELDPPDYGSEHWESFLQSALGEIILDAANEAGEDLAPISAMFSAHWDTFLKRAHEELFSPGFGMPSGHLESYYTQTTEGWQRLINFGVSFYGGLNSDLTPFMDPTRKPKGAGGGGRSGPRRLTPEEIRNQYDVDELANRADRIKQSLVLETFRDPRGLARSYVDAVVASKGEKKIDFDTFVEERVKETGRFKSIFRNLPPGMDPRQYIAPIYQLAASVAPDEAEARAIGAAQFGASVQQQQARLAHTDAVTGSSAFINKFQNNLSQLKGILRG